MRAVLLANAIQEANRRIIDRETTGAECWEVVFLSQLSRRDLERAVIQG